MCFLNLWYSKENIGPLHIQHTMLQLQYHVTTRGVAWDHLPISVPYFVWFFNHGATDTQWAKTSSSRIHNHIRTNRTR